MQWSLPPPEQQSEHVHSRRWWEWCTGVAAIAAIAAASALATNCEQLFIALLAAADRSCCRQRDRQPETTAIQLGRLLQLPLAPRKEKQGHKKWKQAQKENSESSSSVGLTITHRQRQTVWKKVLTTTVACALRRSVPVDGGCKRNGWKGMECNAMGWNWMESEWGKGERIGWKGRKEKCP